MKHDAALPKLTPKQIKFCEAFVETGNATEAYRRAYNAENMQPSTITKRASELVTRGGIKAMIDHLQATHREKHKVTVESMTSDLRQIKDAACAAGQFGAAASAAKTIAQIHGLLVNRQEIKASNEHSFNLAESLVRIARLDEGDLINVTPKNKSLNRVEKSQ